MRYILLLLITTVVITAKGQNNYDFIVAKDGSGKFKTVQEAIDAVPHLRNNKTTIYIKNGVYKEKIIVPSTKNNIALIGEDVDSTILTYDDYASKPNSFGENVGTSGSSSFYLYGNDFYAENITFENSSGSVGQAVAMRVDGDRVVFNNCRFLGYQDTLYPHGVGSRQYYKNCYIEGTVDFIFGKGTAYFDECNIYCKANGYITAAATEKDTEYGFIFNKCKVYGDSKKETHYLGRPWRPYAMVLFKECELGNNIRKEGWNNWDNSENEKTARYYEYKNEGKGADTTNRVEWGKEINQENIGLFSIEKVFGDWDPRTVLSSSK